MCEISQQGVYVRRIPRFGQHKLEVVETRFPAYRTSSRCGRLGGGRGDHSRFTSLDSFILISSKTRNACVIACERRCFK